MVNTMLLISTRLQSMKGTKSYRYETFAGVDYPHHTCPRPSCAWLMVKEISSAEMAKLNQFKLTVSDEIMRSSDLA
jgi:hypothetical protein